MSPAPSTASPFEPPGELTQVLRLLHLVIENTRVMVVVTNAGGEIEWVNGAYVRLTGWTLEEIRGRRPASFLQGPDTDQATVRRLGEALARGEGVDDVELLNYRKDRTPYWVSLNIQPVRNAGGAVTHFVSIQTDITERKHAEQRLRDSERRLAEAQRLARIGSWELDLSSNVLEWSDEVFRIFEIDSRRFGANYQFFLDRVHPEDRELVDKTYWASVQNRALYEVEHRLQFDDGRIKWVIERGESEYDERGAPVLSRGSVQDITERKAAEAARRETELAQRSNQAKTQFLTQMSHELRTPLNAVLGFSQILLADEKSPLTPLQADRVQYVQDAGEHMLALITDLLDLSCIEAGRMALSIEALDLDPIVREAQALLQGKADQRRITIRVAPTALRVMGDRTRLRQVLVNLLSNAVKYNHDGGEVTVTSRRDAHGAAMICVADTGLGISADHIERLFKPFDRLGQESGPIEGTGIGLALAKAIIEHMHGSISVDSEVGHGSKFCVRLNCQAAVAPAAPAATLAPPATDAPACQERTAAGTVLYIEDKPIDAVAVLRELDRLLGAPR